jgi:S-adenosylmethionine:diacylglycerol 3-amino-3-carboxypropyl transferase
MPRKKPEPIKFTKSKNNDLFPWQLFVWRLEDRKENKVCHFECYEHAEKYIRRYQLKKTQYKLQVKV